MSACEHCGSKKNLESAHVHGRDRNEIIDLVFKDYIYNGVATVDIEKFEERFKDEHFPLERSILSLCQPCHKNYDNSVPVNDKTDICHERESPGERTAVIRSRNNYLPITLEPGDPESFKQELLVTKIADIEATTKTVELKQSNGTLPILRFLRTSLEIYVHDLNLDLKIGKTKT